MRMTNGVSLPDHLMLLPDESMGRWALWRTACVRGAGFPAAEILRIADGECAAAADRLAAVEEEAERLRQAALEALREELGTAGRKRVYAVVNAIGRVKKGQPVTTEGLAAATAAAIDAWRAAVTRAEAERESYRAAFAEAEECLDRELREIAGCARFREAVVWQNRHAAEAALDAFLRRPAGKGLGSSRDRAHALMIASYLQRYCTKNDTIGFFGPVGWARLSENGEVIAARPGKELVAARQVYFEGWAIDAIADRLAEEEAMRPWLAPRRSPYLRREGDAYVAPGGEKLPLDPLGCALLAACDGARPARALVRELAPDGGEAVLWELLAELHAQGALRWAFQIPLSPTPERTLRELLLRIEDEPLRERALAVLDDLERGRDAVARAAGDVGALERALEDLEATFTRFTGRLPRRGDGQNYNGRTLVYEDCRRDLEVDLGGPLFAELAPALSLLLASARWFTHFVAADHREAFSRIHEELSAQTGSSQVDLMAFSRVALTRMVNPQRHRELQRALFARWEQVLEVPQGERRVAYRSEDLLPRVMREFAAPGPGWRKARYHSPDLMIAAPSLEAIRQGDYQAVLGEIHVSMNTLDRWLFFSQHPHPERLRAAIESDLPEPSLIPIFPKVWNRETASASLGIHSPAANGRMDLALRSPKDFYLDMSLDPHAFPSSRVLSIADLVIEPGESGLVVRPHGGGVCFDVIEFYQLALMIQMLASFRVLPTSAYMPRVTIDRLVVIRESWTFPLEELEFADASTPSERFAAARRWAGRRDLPRFLFATTPGELKPFYVDLESPVLVENLARAVRRGAKEAENDEEAQVQLSEMLPGHEGIWLPDAEGNRYTCELRMVALDLG